jgi:hypothetical protein
MVTRSLYKGQDDILAIGYGAGTWQFDLTMHLTLIHEMLPDHDLYLVGYRNEERPVIPGVSPDQHKRINVPFFAVHALPKGAASQPRGFDRLLGTQDGRNCLAEPYSMRLQWVKVGAFRTGQDVKMLVSSFARTTVGMGNDTDCSAGHLWFAIPVDYRENPGEDFVFVYHQNGHSTSTKTYGTKPESR